MLLRNSSPRWRATALADIYSDEFEEMYNGDFHTAKIDNTTHVLPTLADGTVIKSYFAPTDDAETHAIVAAINAAHTKINMRTFFLTSETIVDALKDAKDRGVTVRIILDAASAENVYSLHASLRSYGVSVKVENWGGTEHTKAFSVDGYIVVLGSQNFTLSGNTSSDENTLYIENRRWPPPSTPPSKPNGARSRAPGLPPIPIRSPRTRRDRLPISPTTTMTT